MTTHKVLTTNSNNLSEIDDKSIDLVVTSPPYPMIEMWDAIWGSNIDDILKTGNGYKAFINMHNMLNDVWKECDRVLKDGGFVCINIGDATRTINNKLII